MTSECAARTGKKNHKYKNRTGTEKQLCTRCWHTTICTKREDIKNGKTRISNIHLFELWINIHSLPRKTCGESGFVFSLSLSLCIFCIIFSLVVLVPSHCVTDSTCLRINYYFPHKINQQHDHWKRLTVLLYVYTLKMVGFYLTHRMWRWLLPKHLKYH